MLDFSNAGGIFVVSLVVFMVLTIINKFDADTAAVWRGECLVSLNEEKTATTTCDTKKLLGSAKSFTSSDEELLAGKTNCIVEMSKSGYVTAKCGLDVKIK